MMLESTSPKLDIDVPPIFSTLIKGTSTAGAPSILEAKSQPRAPRRTLRYGSVMADDILPIPEPKPIDEKLSLQLRHLAEDAVLRGRPNGDERCDNCLFYLEPDAKIAYCWHPKLRVLVGDQWWCQWWEPLPKEG
jgi:hypothetical protein